MEGKMNVKELEAEHREKTVNKTQERLDLWCSAPGIQFKDTQAEENYKKRARRIADSLRIYLS